MHTRLGDQRAAGLEQQLAVEPRRHAPDQGGERRGVDPRLVVVVHAEAAAEVEPAQRDALRSQAREQLDAAAVGGLERLEARDLRADMQVHADRARCPASRAARA